MASFSSSIYSIIYYLISARGPVRNSRILIRLFKIRKPVYTAHQQRTSDDISDGNRQQIHQKEVSRRQIREIGNRLQSCHVVCFIGVRDESRHAVVHVRDAVFKAAEHEQHDRKEKSRDLSRHCRGRKADPHRDADQEITQNAHTQRFRKCQRALVGGNLDGTHRESSAEQI